MSYGSTWQVFDRSELILRRNGDLFIVGAQCGDEISTIELPPAAARKVVYFILEGLRSGSGVSLPSGDL